MTDRPTIDPPPGPVERVEGFETLAELALDIRSAWNHSTDFIWRSVDPVLWGLTHNPWVVLQTASPARLRELFAEPAFRSRLDDLLRERRDGDRAPLWFGQNHPQSPLTAVAYFSMEFMVSEALPIYSGGLGNVAGDQLKAASDLGVPVVGVGLLYSQGYFHQVIDPDGEQQALFPFNDPGQLPIRPLLQANGEWLRFQIALPGYPVWLRGWEARVGRARLLLLDSNDAANYPAHRGITSELYGGGPELRIKQEMILGIGGWRLLEALGIRPEVCHLNEGHAAFAVLERARSFMGETGRPFEVALAATRGGNLFTTHTAVDAGFDRFAPDLLAQHLGPYAAQDLGISLEELLALGRCNPRDNAEPFNMAYLAIRGSGAVNAVSRLHRTVSQRLFLPLFPHWSPNDVPVGYVTNGVHMSTWDSAAADELWTQACGQARWRGRPRELEEGIRTVSDGALWEFRKAGRAALVSYARARLSRDLAASGMPAEAIEEAKHLFDPNALTLGFARRFAAYKRPNLLLHDPERLTRILSDVRRPVQLIIAGKAHPADAAGQALIQEWIRFIRRPELRPHVIFLSDYDMLLTENLVQGVDVWINTPRRPWEACGTSGMKVLVNGGLNLSELDGWWAEAYSPEVGWALGDRRDHDEDPAWDAAEADALYDLLEREVVPQFYERDADGVPRAWVRRIRESMARLTPHFSTNRSLLEYTEQHYLPAAANWRRRAANAGAEAAGIVDWQRRIAARWDAVGFGQVHVETRDGQHAFEVPVFLDGLTGAEVQVELFAEAAPGEPPLRLEMTAAAEAQADPRAVLYRATAPAARPAADFTPRVTPRREGVAVPLEFDAIRWQR